MKKIAPLFALSLAALASPVFAQSTAEEAAEDAIELAVDAAQSAARPADWSASVQSPRPVDYMALELRPADYPASSWVADEEGMVEYELSVDADGKVSDCSITQSSTFAALDAKTCEIALSRGVFQPATNDDGEVIAGVYRDRMIWTKREPEFAGTATIHVRYNVAKDGEVTDCDVVELSGAISDRMRQTFEREPCPGMNRPARALYRDENGNPVAKTIELQVIVKAETIEE
uniref:TonB family protein n=1 Tax=uncultured Erythrobacter sp. TaxID=263913 RepID=UPI00262FE197|nr:TonB family protein [uncultured Erythrobacter sp.]